MQFIQYYRTPGIVAFSRQLDEADRTFGRRLEPKEHHRADTRLCIINGLQSETGALLNGKVGEVMDWNQKTSRFCVRINLSDLKHAWKKIKPEFVWFCNPYQLRTCGELSSVKSSIVCSLHANRLFDLEEILQLLHCLRRTRIDIQVDSLVLHTRAFAMKTSQMLGSLLCSLHHASTKTSSIVMKCCAAEIASKRLDGYWNELRNAIGDNLSKYVPVYNNGMMKIATQRWKIVKEEIAHIAEEIRVSFVLEASRPSNNLGHLPLKISPQPVYCDSTASCDHVSEVFEEGDEIFQEVDHGSEEPARRDESILQTEADHIWADAVQNLISSNTQSIPEGGLQEWYEEPVYVYPYSRTPAEFREVLLQGTELEHVRSDLQKQGYSCILEPSGAKVFVRPEQYAQVVQSLAESSIVLHTSHVIIAQSFIPELEASIANIPTRRKVRVKMRDVVRIPYQQPFDEDANDAEETSVNDTSEFEWSELLAVDRTFLCTTRNLKPSASVSQSTTEVHGGINPRRYVSSHVSL